MPSSLVPPLSTLTVSMDNLGETRGRKGVNGPQKRKTRTLRKSQHKKVKYREEERREEERRGEEGRGEKRREEGMGGKEIKLREIQRKQKTTTRNVI